MDGSGADKGQVIRGGKGDDIIHSTLLFGAGADGDVLWVEGNEGDDYIIGGDSQQISSHYWGGDGDDYIIGGDYNVGGVSIHGNDGDDRLLSGDENLGDLVVKGNDGDDYITGGINN